MTFVSLIGICDALRAFYLLDPPNDQMRLLVREIEKKDKTMVYARSSLPIAHDLENLHLENVSLVQKSNEASNACLTVFYESFDNALLQVEHFYSQLKISREHVWSGQIIKYRKVVSLID